MAIVLISRKYVATDIAQKDVDRANVNIVRANMTWLSRCWKRRFFLRKEENKALSLGNDRALSVHVDVDRQWEYRSVRTFSVSR